MLSRWINASGRRGGGLGLALNTMVRCFSRKRAENPRKINPKVPPQEATNIAQSLYDLIQQRGPLSVSNTWIQAKEAGVEGLNSKTHLKLMLKWMRGRKLLKLFCQQFGSNKKFLISTLPDGLQQQQELGEGGEGGEGEGEDRIKLQTQKKNKNKRKPAASSKKKMKK